MSEYTNEDCMTVMARYKDFDIAHLECIIAV